MAMRRADARIQYPQPLPTPFSFALQTYFTIVPNFLASFEISTRRKQQKYKTKSTRTMGSFQYGRQQREDRQKNQRPTEYTAPEPRRETQEEIPPGEAILQS